MTRPRLHPDEWYGQVAQAYLYGPERRRKTLFVAAAMDLTYDQAAKAVSRCRKMGLIPPTTQGRVAAPRLR